MSEKLDNINSNTKVPAAYDCRNPLHPEFVDRVFDDLGKAIEDFCRMLEKDLGVPQKHPKIVRDEKESPPVAAGSKEFIDNIPDPRLRLVYRRRMCATDRRTDWRT